MLTITFNGFKNKIKKYNKFKINVRILNDLPKVYERNKELTKLIFKF